MEKICYRVVIKYLRKEGLASNGILINTVDKLGDGPPALSTVHKWATEFIRGRESLEDVDVLPLLPVRKNCLCSLPGGG